MVFGRRAGEAAAEYASALSAMPAVNPDQVRDIEQIALAPFEESGTENPYEVMQDLQKMMEHDSGIVRLKEELAQGVEKLQSFKQRIAKVRVEGNRQYNPGWHYALDLHNLVTVSEAITLSALHRDESRGGHTREDFPDSSPELEKVNTVVRDRDGEMAWEHISREPMPDDLRELLSHPHLEDSN